MTPAKARPSAGRKAAPAPSPSDAAAGILVIGEEAEDPRYEPLFRLAGKNYDVLVNPPGSLLAKYLHQLRHGGGNLAVSWLLEQMLQPAAYQAIQDNPKVSDADLRKVTRLCAQILTGTAAPKSPAPAAPSGTP